MKLRGFLTTIIAICTVITISNCSDKKQQTENDLMLEAAHQHKDYNRLLQLADSMEACGGISGAKACYWRGYAYDRMKDKQQAETYWRKALNLALNAGDKDEWEMYEKSASRLANLLCINRDYEGTLKITLPAIEILEEQKRDTTSDYVNLLIYTGLCQVSTGTSEEDADNAFFRACQKHQENIARNRCDATYKDAIAGLVNIAYYCVNAGKNQAALYYTSSFGELLGEYEQRPGADTTYVDRQAGRYTIYKAQALEKLGRKKESASCYDAFLNTKFSKSTEGQLMADEYQKLLQK